MKPLRRILATVLLGAALAALLIAPAQAFTVTGGTAEQRADVYLTINAIAFPSVEWVESKVGSVRIEILDSYPPYWLTTLGSSDEYLVDVFSATAAGVAWPGNIRIHSYYTPGDHTFFREIVSHEMSHQVWFALLHVSGASAEWRALVEDGAAPGSGWWYSYVESHAEQLRMAAWGPLYWQTPYPRTYLNRLGNAAVRDFHARWTGTNPPPPPPTTSTTRTTLPPTTTTSRYTPPVRTTTTTVPPPTTSTTAAPTTTTTERNDPFPDVTRADSELWNAAWWGLDSGIWWGYPNGHLEPYLLLTHRHAALLADRWVGVAISEWIFDYSPVTRGELRDALPGLDWDSERWAETLLRSQMLRLMYRGSLQ